MCVLFFTFYCQTYPFYTCSGETQGSREGSRASKKKEINESGRKGRARCEREGDGAAGKEIAIKNFCEVAPCTEGYSLQPGESFSASKSEAALETSCFALTLLNDFLDSCHLHS